MYKHILIATDGSELAEKALGHGLGLAKALGAKVTIVTATPMWSALEMTEHARHHEPHPVEEFESRHTVTARRVLDRASVLAAKADMSCDLVHARDSDPDKAIVDTARARGCDLIVMSSHGRGPMGRLLLGSVAVKVLTYTTIPVQIIR